MSFNVLESRSPGARSASRRRCAARPRTSRSASPRLKQVEKVIRREGIITLARARETHPIGERYHDFLLAQGLLPPGVLAKTLLAEFVPAGKAAGAP